MIDPASSQSRASIGNHKSTIENPGVPMPLRYDFDEDGLRRPADDLRRLVRYQRWVMGVVLAQIAL
jgi:hypothetical protein